MTQKEALDILKLGHSAFLTGAPGAGKTHVLNQFIDHLHAHDVSVGITASTGIAATHIGGSTIHSWSGIGIKDDIDDGGLAKIASRSSHKSRLKFARVLIIDEISMLDGARLDLINRLLKIATNSEKPFGGVQVVMTGDLFQLPPVSKGEPDFPHLSRAWRELNPVICYLSEQYRTEDPELLDILGAMRAQDLEEAHFSALSERQTEEYSDESITKLYTHNRDVDSINSRMLEGIEDEPRYFSMRAHGREQLAEALIKGCLAPEQLVLKVGAEVMFVANRPANGYFNGTRGVVLGYDEDDRPVVKVHATNQEVVVDRASWAVNDGPKTLAEIVQFPLRLAWAITVHKSQGMSLDAAEIDLSKAFTPGMGYVALSRVRSLDGLRLKGLNNMAMRVHPGVAEFDQQLKERSAHAVDSLSQIPKTKLKKAHKYVISNLALPYAEYDKDLFEALKKWRTAQAKQQSVPPYMVLSDKSLYALAAEKPETLSQLTAVPGIGAAKRDQYAADLLGLVRVSNGALL